MKQTKNLLIESSILSEGSFSIHYEISNSLILVYYFKNKEFAFINGDTGEEFLFAENHEEAQKICMFIKHLTENKQQ